MAKPTKQAENTSEIIVGKSILLTDGLAKKKDIITNTNTVRWFGLTIFLINVVVNYLLDYTYSFFVCAGASVLLLLSIILIKQKNYTLTRFVFIIILHVSVILLNNIEGLINGNYIYLFIFIIVIIFIFDFSEKRELIAAYGVSVFSIIYIFIAAPLHSNLQRISSTMEKNTFVFNVTFSVIVICVLCFVILRRNFFSEKELRNKEQFLDTVYNTSLDAVLIIDPQTGFINDCNNQSLKVFGIENSTSLIKQHVRNLFYSIPITINFESLLKHKKLSWKGEMECVTPGGVVFPGYVSIISFTDNDKYYKKLSILDISDIKKAQNQMQAEKEKAEQAVKAKSVFLSNMSHELRTPLNGIIGITNLLVEEANPAIDSNYIDLLKYSSEHMLGLINDVLDFSKIEAGKMDIIKESFNLQATLQNVFSFFTPQFAKKNIILEWNKIGNNLDRKFIADKTRVTQVLSNLIANALKFTDKGKVTVTVFAEASNQKSAHIKFSVKDTGIGIPKDKQEIIFESFGQADTATTRKYGGTGLGLAISKKIVEQYNGTLTVSDNEERKGSNFSFTMELPYDIEIPFSNKPTEITDKKLHSLAGLKILIVEDNFINMVVAKKFLNKWNVETMSAANGLLALDVLKENNKFDLLLIDLEMPEMDGHQLIKVLRENNNETPAMAFTAAGYDNIFNDLVSKGFTDYVQKPFNPDDLHSKIKKYTNFKVEQDMFP